MLFRGMDSRKVELVCAECGYGIVVATLPDACPMCRATSWDLPAWRPFTPLAEYHAIFDKPSRLPEPLDPLELAAVAPRPTKRPAVVTSLG